METKNLSFLVTGDLAFYYDMNALGIRHIRNNVRILLINNNGGAEFKLGGLESKTDVSTHISAAGHFKSAHGWAEDCGFTYISVKSKEDLDKYKKSFVAISDKPILMEVFTTPEAERTANQTIASSNIAMTSSEMFVKNMKTTVKKYLVMI